MTLQRLSIKKLFGQFDYDISLVNQDGIIILTGPNGYGKTTMLNIIYSLFSANFDYFQSLNFENIEFMLSDNQKIVLSKGKQETVTQRLVQTINGQQHVTTQSIRFINIHIDLEIEGRIVGQYIYNYRERDKLFQGMIKYLPFPEIAVNLLKLPMNNNSKFELNHEVLQQELQKKSFDVIFSGSQKNELYQKFHSIFSVLNVYFIKEQRLIKQVTLLGPSANPTKPEISYVNTIQNFAADLQNQITAMQTKAFQIGQQLDSTYLTRILNQYHTLTKDDFDKRINELAIKQKQLKDFGITLSSPETPEYDASKADVLFVFLDDSEKKAAVFDDLSAKINLFVTALSNKRLTKKTLKISASSGFSVVTEDGKNINLSFLSSGEQQEIVLLYELLFKTEPNSLILIDEPEISLHVTWQKEFVKDLLEIAKIKNISFCLATHSPQIINGRWDLVTDLYTLVNKTENPDFEENNVW